MTTPYDSAVASETPASTADAAYANRLAKLQLRTWKERLRFLDPWGWNVRRFHPGFMLDVGCGVGRTLTHNQGNGIGVDHNAEAVAICRVRGLRAFTPDEFAASEWATPERFDALLFAHVLEHIEPAGATGLVARYLPYLRPSGQVIVITPQERGQASDTTHVALVDFEAAAEILTQAGLAVTRQRSFPLPRWFGRRFMYNEFVTVARRPGVPAG